MHSSLLKMHGINKAFGGVSALRGAALEIGHGEVHALIGQNGAGKSTLIKILTGVYRRDSGSVDFNGKASTISNPREAQSSGISTIYQELTLVPLRSVTENIVLGYEPRRIGGLIDWKEAHRRSQEILARFNIDIDVKAPLGTYSTAIQQLVAIARAVSLNAKLVIMDEPTSSLDDNEVAVLFSVVKSLKESGVSVLYVSHFLDELFKICDRVTIMRDGQTVKNVAIQDTSKLDLIANMLGRNADDIESAGMTEFAKGEAKTGDVILRTENVATKRLLRKFNLKIHRGEIVGLGGLLGSGRTEAARAIFGVDELTKGTIRLANGVPRPATPKQAIAAGIGFLSEDRKSEGIIPDMSVRENLTLAFLPHLSRFGHIDHAREKELVSSFISALGIKTAHMDQPIRELSGGNQQKVLLARWLVTNPSLLILDEPTRGVDVGAKLEIQSIIRKYVDKGLAVLLISSEFEELVEGADRIVVLQDGISVSELKNPGITEDTLVRAIAHHHTPDQQAAPCQENAHV
ncbi:sugar ABC transporter ATP-binding protein [Thalassospira sp.]|uniref:sugar ABC transporter ATP-binding protein n=1 Tax=Thalassospira sp. TaxID=1912094 RepID=UPI003AA99A34